MRRAALHRVVEGLRPGRTWERKRDPDPANKRIYIYISR